VHFLVRTYGPQGGHALAVCAAFVVAAAAPIVFALYRRLTRTSGLPSGRRNNRPTEAHVPRLAVVALGLIAAAAGIAAQRQEFTQFTVKVPAKTEVIRFLDPARQPQTVVVPAEQRSCRNAYREIAFVDREEGDECWDKAHIRNGIAAKLAYLAIGAATLVVVAYLSARRSATPVPVQ
jgi:hypothetical protein